MAKPYAAPGEFESPKQRSCTDVLCIILLLAVWILLSIIGFYAYRNGNYRVILYPMDYDGNICGTAFGDVNMTEFSKIVYVNNFAGGVCVNECPKIDSLVDIRTLITYNGVYQGENASIPTDFIKVANYTSSDNVQICNPNDCPMDPNISYLSRGISKGNGFAYYAVSTFEALHGRCISNPNAIEKVKEQVYVPDANALNIRMVDDAADFFGHLYGDIYTANSYILLFGFCGSLILGFIYSQLLRFKYILGSLVWSSIFVTVTIIFAAGSYAYYSAYKWQRATTQIYHDNTIFWTKVLSYVLFGVGLIVVFLLIFLRREIQLAMACVKEASRAIGSMILMTLFPFIQCAGLVGFFAVWSVYAVNLASMGKVVPKNLPLDAVVSVRHYEYDDNIIRSGWFLLFSFFWTVGFISALGEIIVAMSISKWYFARDKNQIGSSTFCRSVASSMYYHSGTAALGSLLIAIVQLIRVVLSGVQRKARQLDNKLGEALLCCCQCCLWFFEKFIQFLSKNAYIQTAIFGTSFCQSSKEAFSLIMRNAKRVGSINYVSALVLFVGKIFISFATAGVSYIVIDYKLSSELYSAMGPALLVLFISYFIGEMFLDIFEMSTSTILHCFIADEEMFHGDECFADGKLRQWFDNFDEEEEKQIRVLS